MKKSILFLLGIASLASAVEVWNIIPDFPTTDPFPTTMPINGWVWGYHCVQAPHWALTPDTDYYYDVFADGSATTGYYILRSGNGTTPDMRVRAMDTWGSSGIRPYGQKGCVAMRPHYALLTEGTVDDHIVDTFIQWQAPADGYYDIDMGVLFNSGNADVEVTITVNGVAVEGVDGALASTQPRFLRIGEYLASGDEVRLSIHGVADVDNMTPIFAEIAQTQQPAYWDIFEDFPSQQSFVYPYHNWTLGTECVKTTWAGYEDGGIYEYDLFTDTGSNYILRGPSASYAPDARLDSYATNPVFSLRSRLQTNSNGEIINNYGSFLKWTAPVSGKYIIDLGTRSSSQNAKITFALNDEAIEGISDANSLNTNLGVSLFGYELTAGDEIKILVASDPALAAESINYQTQVAASAMIRLDDNPQIVEDFEDADISDWAIGDDVVEITDEMAYSGSYALKVQSGANDFARATKEFFNGNARNIQLTAQIFAESNTYDPEGGYIKLYSTDGSYVMLYMNVNNVIRFSTNQLPSSGGWQTPDNVLYENIGVSDGWNEFKAVFDSEGKASIFFNNMLITEYDGMQGLNKMELGIAYDPAEGGLIFDDIVIVPTVAENECLGSDFIHLSADMNNDCVVDELDLEILAANWLDGNPGSDTEGVFDSFEYRNFTTAVDAGWSVFQGTAIITDDIARSGNEAIMIPTGAFGRIGKLFNNYPVDCTVSAWLYLPQAQYRAATEVNILDADYSKDNYIRVSALNDIAGGTIATAVGSQQWAYHPSVSVIDGWNKVSFTVSTTATDVYFNDQLLFTVPASTFSNFKLLSIGKGGWYDEVCPIDGEVVFDDVSVFASTNLSGEADAFATGYEADYQPGINLGDFAAMASQWGLVASQDSRQTFTDKQYIVANLADTGGTGINQYTFDNFVRKLPNDTATNYNAAVSRSFRCLDADPCTPSAVNSLVSDITDFMAFSESYNIPIVIQFDVEQWWGQRPDLWNWWDTEAEGYDPNNIDNVEWYGWSNQNATKIAWRNWGSQTRRSPAPNLMGAGYRAECHRILDYYVPLVVDWYNSLPQHKKHLLLGFKVGWESSIGINAFYYPNGNYYLETFPEDDSNDPTYGINASLPPNYGVQQIGYAALVHSGLKTSGTITEADLAQIVGLHLSDLCQRANSLGIPTEKIFTSCWTFQAQGTNTLAAVNDYSGPGWSFYTYNSSQKLTDTADIVAAVLARTTQYWAINESYLLGDNNTAQWETYLDGNIEPDCKYINLYNWHSFMDNDIVLDAIKDMTEN